MNRLIKSYRHCASVVPVPGHWPAGMNVFAGQIPGDAHATHAIVPDEPVPSHAPLM